MKIRIWNGLAVTLSLFAGESGIAASLQPPEARPAGPAVLTGSQMFDLTSKINGATYRLTVILPEHYTTSSFRYPVLYLMDGDELALLAQYTVPRLSETADISQLIVVGVGYPGATERGMDYAPAMADPPWPIPANRGADIFLAALTKEIVPFIDSQFRTEPTVRGMGGHSLGGLITTYALFHASGTFNRFWISSASLFWNHESIFQDESAYLATHSDLDARVYADVGSDEMPVMRSLPIRLRDVALSRHWKNLSWTLTIPPGQIHMTVPSTVFADALHTLFGNRPNVRVTAVRLRMLSGRYRLPNGKILNVTTDGRHLYSTGLTTEGEPDYRARLSAESPDIFYSRAEAVDLRFGNETLPAPEVNLIRWDEGPERATRIR
jgi:hypothetical protein